jgi:hypothetical protein
VAQERGKGTVPAQHNPNEHNPKHAQSNKQIKHTHKRKIRSGFTSKEIKQVAEGK